MNEHEVITRYEPLVYAAALRQVGDQHLAADIAQGAMLAFVQKAGKLRDGQPVGPWLLRVTHYLAVDAMRSGATRRRHEREFARQRNEACEAGQLRWRSLEPVLDAALHQLSDADRVILTLRYLQEWEIEKIGRELEIAPAAVRQRLSRALRRLRVILTKRGLKREDLVPLAVPWWLGLKRYLWSLVPAKGFAIVIGAIVICAGGIYWSVGAMRKTPPTPNPVATHGSGLRAQSTIP